MAVKTVTIPWGDGTTDKIYLTWNDASLPGVIPVDIASDPKLYRKTTRIPLHFYRERSRWWTKCYQNLHDYPNYGQPCYCRLRFEQDRSYALECKSRLSEKVDIFLLC